MDIEKIAFGRIILVLYFIIICLFLAYLLYDKNNLSLYLVLTLLIIHFVLHTVATFKHGVLYANRIVHFDELPIGKKLSVYKILEETGGNCAIIEIWDKYNSEIIRANHIPNGFYYENKKFIKFKDGSTNEIIG
jgi:hypothetical protein